MPAAPGAPRLLLIDNVDSFTFMLADTLRQVGADVVVVRRDLVDVDGAMDGAMDGIVISPGPGRPEDAGPSVEIAAACIAAERPLLGVCLGHQAIAIACGGSVGRIPPVHGKTGIITHDGSGLFASLKEGITATRYHSLAVTAVPALLRTNAWSEDGTIMGLRHVAAPVHGLQFHPESVGTPHGRALLASFVATTAKGA